MNFKQWLEAFRIDSQKIDDFSKNLQNYYASPDESSSGKFTNDKLPSEFKHWKPLGKGLFAGKEKEDVIPYALPRDLSWIKAYVDPKRPTLFINKNDKHLLSNYNPTLSYFDSNKFKTLKSGELFSKLPELPERQEKIRNVISFIKQWMNVYFVDDLIQTKKDLTRKKIDFDSEGI